MNLGIYPFPGFLTGCAELTFNDQKNTCPTFPCFFGNKTIKQHLDTLETFKSEIEANLLQPLKLSHVSHLTGLKTRLPINKPTFSNLDWLDSL